MYIYKVYVYIDFIHVYRQERVISINSLSFDVKNFSSRSTRATRLQESKRKRCPEIALAFATRRDFDEIVASLYSCAEAI